MVKDNRHRNIADIIDKVTRDRSHPQTRNYDQSDYNFDNFEDVADMVKIVTDKALLHNLQNANSENLATIMKRVIAEYFDPEYKPEKIHEKKKSVLSRFGF